MTNFSLTGSSVIFMFVLAGFYCISCSYLFHVAFNHHEQQNKTKQKLYKTEQNILRERKQFPCLIFILNQDQSSDDENEINSASLDSHNIFRSKK